jgi:predicted nucleic acid-binding protein
VTLYAESSAVLAWLLGEPNAADVRRHLAESELVIASDLTLVECDRVLIRAEALAELDGTEVARRRADLTAAAAHWAVLRLSPDVTERARQRFAHEPIRTLDALHLASALVARTAAPDVRILSLDLDVRANARTLGFDVVPPDETATAVTEDAEPNEPD